MTEPVVSIISTTFNHRHFVERCIRSVQRQSYPNWEHIVIDDASTDGTADLAAQVAGGDTRVKLIRHPHRIGADGIVGSFNEGLSASTGEFVAVLAGDDWWEPDRLALQVPLFIDAPSVVLSYGDCWEVFESGRRIGRIAAPISRDSLRTSPPATVPHFAQLKAFPALTVLVRRSALEAIGGFRSHGRIMDFPTWLQLSLLGDFVRVPTPIANWRRHKGSALWRYMEGISHELHGSFTSFVSTNEDSLRSAQLDPRQLVASADRALDRRLRSIPYLDAQYELLCGSRTSACSKFARVVVDTQTPTSLRASATVGIVASLTTRRLFSAALAAKRRLQAFGARRG